MADKLPPEELAGIYKTHEEDQKRLDADAENGLIVLPPWSAHPHRAALLRHVEAMEQEVERLREALADAENCHRTSDQWRSHYQTKLARLVDGLEQLKGSVASTWVFDRIHALIVEATGEGK